VKGRTGYFMIAILLTILNVFVTVYYGLAIWKARPEDIWDRGLLVLLAALGATLLVNVWVQAVLGSGVSLCSRTIDCERSTTPISAEARGHSDV
jgi:hypothetical protein